MRASQLSILDQIVVRKRAELLMDRSRAPLDQLEQRVRDAGAAGRRGFRRALERNQPAIIAEIKKASPSVGDIARDAPPAGLARRYEQAGAAALSVLTDIQFFAGSLADLEQAREAVRVPVLRKDFTIDPYHVWQAAAHNADAILLIVAILPQPELRGLLQLARELSLDAMAEVHDREELDRALEAGADLNGVNNRNLKTFEVSLDTSIELGVRMPPGVLPGGRGGIRSPEGILRLAAAGCRAFLGGESLRRAAVPGQALEALLSGATRATGNH